MYLPDIVYFHDFEMNGFAQEGIFFYFWQGPWISYKERWRAGMASFCIYNPLKWHRHRVSSCKTVHFHHWQFDVGDLFQHPDLQGYCRYSSFSCNHPLCLRSLKPLVILCLTEFVRTVNKGAGGRVATTVNNSFLLFSQLKLCFCRKRPKLGKAFDKERKMPSNL